VAKAKLARLIIVMLTARPPDLWSGRPTEPTQVSPLQPGFAL